MMDGIKTTGWWAGIALAIGVSVAAGYAASWVGTSLLGFAKSPISAIMMAIVLGMIVANTIKLPAGWQPGLKFCTSVILKVGIMLLGIRLSLLSAGQFTLVALPFVIAAIAAGLLTVGLIGKYMGLSKQLSGLIAVGTSICGCTAIVAVAPLIKANESEVSYSIACITIFGLAAMFFYPLLAHYAFANQPELAGLFLGSILLKHGPHHRDILLRVAPVATRIEVSQKEFFLQSRFDSCRCPGNFSRHKRLTSPW